MAVGTPILFSKNKDDLRLNDLPGAVVKLALLTSAANPNTAVAGHSLWADLSANEIAAGNGYAAGGAALSNDAVTAIVNGYKYASDNVVWNAAGGNIPAWRYAVFYVSGSLWGMASPLLAVFVGDDTPADVPATTAGNPLTINCPADGWFDLT